jgi:hypothetical protein
MNVEVFIVVVDRNPLGDLCRECPRILLPIATGRVEKPQRASDKCRHDDPERQPAFAFAIGIFPFFIL